ncbi:hypothetical protein CHS0354_034900 [Potamilus streckersoni]|uniref:DNA-directed primase/polymerase protein n=1 Tax=Potamilus streckersoni TaxID=2493646 RepID=A0AAE0SEA7_9BIVA|nr:hypothetical protein CHS0354_034900 [Potamilus streckersoni]
MDGADKKSMFTIQNFYGSHNIRKRKSLEKVVEETVKRHKAAKIPTNYHHRILGPTSSWDIFFRQKDAFKYARRTAKDLHVFAFESETFSSHSGQRMYLVSSYPVFWHYYCQLDESKRHHYEIIPEGSVCKLYFDLEFLKENNLECDGSRMVEILIKYVCACLREVFSIECDRRYILDLDASTTSKFSRHLVFQIPDITFQDNIHAGSFVCYIFSKLLSYLRPKSSQTIVAGTQSVKNSQEKNDMDNQHAEGKEDEQDQLSALWNQFSKEDLEMLIVKNKNDDETLFCDTGVYTKNRNFRLYLSSKLKKFNPLVVSMENTYQSHVGLNQSQLETVFLDSLVANVHYTDRMKVLTFTSYDSSGNRLSMPKHSNRNSKSTEAIDGYQKSPYPEVDNFIMSLIANNGADGIIRHWTYFQKGELIIYDIVRYRYCENIGRQHKSNNIMYVVDLQNGMYYQKCHDPDCQKMNFKSKSYLIPEAALPAHFFYSEDEDFEFDLKDEDLLNAAAEMERSYVEEKARDFCNSEAAMNQLAQDTDNGELDNEDLITVVDMWEKQ